MLRRDTNMYYSYNSTCRQLSLTLLIMDRLDDTQEFENILRDIESKKTYVKILTKYENGEYTENN